MQGMASWKADESSCTSSGFYTFLRDLQGLVRRGSACLARGTASKVSKYNGKLLAAQEPSSGSVNKEKATAMLGSAKFDCQIWPLEK